MVKRLVFGVETLDDIAKTLAPSQLGEDHANQLLAHSEMPHARLGLETRCQARKGFAMNQIEDLGKNKATGNHPRGIAPAVPKNSNPSHSFFALVYEKQHDFKI
jgi:hypothetical protein